jgi:hypothetical protein
VRELDPSSFQPFSDAELQLLVDGALTDDTSTLARLVPRLAADIQRLKRHSAALLVSLGLTKGHYGDGRNQVYAIGHGRSHDRAAAVVCAMLQQVIEGDPTVLEVLVSQLLTPVDCPDCGHPLSLHLRNGRCAVTGCQDCQGEFPRPGPTPMRRR